MFNTPYTDASPYKVKDSWWISSFVRPVNSCLQTVKFLSGLYWIRLDTCKQDIKILSKS